MTTATPKKPAKQISVKRAAPFVQTKISKATMAESGALSDLAANEANLVPAKKPVEPAYWSETFAKDSTQHSEHAFRLKGAHRDRWNWLAHVLQHEETYSDPSTPAEVRQAMEKAIESKLSEIEMLPKKPDWRTLILPAALFPAKKMDDEVKVPLQKQMSVYRAVYRAAKDEGITSKGLVSFIESRNGIERIRLKKDGEGEGGQGLWDARVQAARDQLVTRDEGTFSVGIGKLFAAENNDKIVALIGTFKPTGEFVVNGALPHDNAAVKTACVAWASMQAKK